MTLRSFGLAGVAVMAVGAVWYVNRPETPVSTPPLPVVANATPVPVPIPPAEELPVTPSQALSVVVSQPEAVAALDRISMSLRDFRTLMRENPTGSNAEIVRALNRGNPKKANLLREEETVNSSGELVDRWGTPYFFHQLSSNQMEVRSAGPDRKMWTGDDIIVK